MVIYPLPASDGQQDDLQGLWLEHDVLDDVVSQAIDVQVGQAALVELLLDVGDLVLQGPHLANRVLHNLKV